MQAIGLCTPLNTYTISVSATPTNGGSASGGGTHNSGATATITATANSGYTFTNWTESGNPVSISSTYTFTVTASRTLVAHFTTSTGISNIEENNFINVYPNPTNGIINIQMSQAEKAQIKITDVLGNSIYSSTLQGGGQIDLSAQPNGVYFISIQTSEGIVNKKIVVSK